MIEKFIEIELPDDDAFLKIKETLTRIGIASQRKKELYQTCHILHKKGKYYIVHFKELFALDGRPTNISQEDIQRRNSIARLIHEWNLCTVVGSQEMEEGLTVFPEKMRDFGLYSNIKVISHKEKSDWKLIPKYSVGTKRQIPS